jgi:repressor LexA
MLTQKQLDVFDCIKTFISSHSRQPTLTEIGGLLGMSSSSTVHKHIRNLITQGYLQSTKGKAAYRLKNNVLPLIGKIAAGSPIEVFNDPQEIDVNQYFQQSGQYILQVTGDSMIEAGIMEGDYIVIRKQSIAEKGEIIVALITDGVNGDEVTLKYFYPQSDFIELRPANASVESMFHSLDKVTIQGIIVGSFRYY